MPRPRITPITVQSRHASEDSRRIVPAFSDVYPEFRADRSSDLRVRVHLLQRHTSADVIRSNRRRRRVFWKNLKAANWVELERALASNYAGVTTTGPLDRTATLDQYRSWQLKDYSLGDLKTELNGTTVVVTYTITLNGNAGSQPLPSSPQHMMTVWQQQKAGWVVIAHSVSQQ
jgi:hypothetical protein